jgi:hypothetical protein
MFATVPPGTGPQAPAAEPVLAWTRHLTMGPRGPRDAHDPVRRREIQRYLADMLAPHGVPYSATTFESGNHNSYALLMEQLLGELALADAEPPDLVVAAHATPDCDPGFSLSGHLNTLLRDSFCFAVSDQGELSPFSALHAIRGLAASGWPVAGWRSALLLAMDQSTLPYAPQSEAAGRTARADHVVGLLFRTRSTASGPVPAGRPLIALRQRQAVPPGGVRRALAAIAASLPPGPAQAAPVTVLAGPGISGADLPARLWDAQAGEASGPLVMTPPGAPCVAVWGELSRLPASAAAGRVIVAEYDRALGGLGVAVLDPPAPAPDMSYLATDKERHDTYR